MVYDEFLVNENVLLILPATNYRYNAVVVSENNEIIKVNRCPTGIIKDSCRMYMTDYDSEKRLAQTVFGFQKKPPIGLNPYLLIYMFPTRSDIRPEVIWINPLHIRSLHTNNKNHKHTDIYFNCGTEYTVDISKYSMETQKSRALEMMAEVTTALGIKIVAKKPGMIAETLSRNNGLY